MNRVEPRIRWRTVAARGAVVVAALCLAARVGAAQPASGGGVLVGYVIDQLGQPVLGAEILIVDAKTPLSTRTVGAGAYRLENVPGGLHLVRIRRLGYLPLSATIDVKANDTQDMDVVLRRLPQQLDPVVVQAENGEMRGAVREFYQRRKVGMGTYIDRAQIEKRQPIFASDLLRTMLGFRLVPDGSSGYRVVSSRGSGSLTSGNCEVQFFVNGMRYMALRGIDDFNPQDIEAIEAYRGSSTIPPQFNIGNAGCGAIVIWLRR